MVLLVSLLTIGTVFGQNVVVKHREGAQETGVERRIGYQYPLPTIELPFYSVLATGSQTIGTSTATLLDTLATYTRFVHVGVTGGGCNFGDSTIPEGTDWPFTIASGTYKVFPIGSQTFSLYFRMQTATGTLFRQEF